ncbi:MAG: hypothetical protein JXR50_01565 [Prolixibacteraceae bacterium]|nr:hypothetical protein [Prolixibacteraceae bacterium]
MKKIIYTLIVITLFFSSTRAQETFQNKFYFRYAISTPTNDYFDYGNWYFDDYSYKKGGAIEIGSIFYLSSIDLGNQLKLGFDINYLSASKHTIDANLPIDLGGGGGFLDLLPTFSLPKTMFYNIGSKAGIILSYNPWDKLIIDINAKANPIWVNAAVVDFKYDKLNYFKGFMGLKYSFGMNLRYDCFMLGTELNLGKLKYQSVDDKDSYIGKSLFPPIDEETLEYLDQDKETNSPAFNISIGFCF